MNDEPMLHGQPARKLPDCGRYSEINRARYFWQSRMTANGRRAPLPELADLLALAKAVRR